jgi:hypothetical protein
MRWRWLVLAAVGVTLASCQRDHREVRTPATTTTVAASTTATTAAGSPVTTADGLGSLPLPIDGVAISYRAGPEGPDVETGVLLVGLDGHVLAKVRDGLVASEGAPGALFLRTKDRDYLLDPGHRGLAPVDRSKLDRLPLANHATLVSITDRDPGRSWIEQDGREVFDLENAMANTVTVSNDRDVVTNQHGDRAVAYDTRTRAQIELPVGCAVADRHADRWLYLCDPDRGGQPTEVRLKRGADTHVVFPRATELGSWRSARFSNDGSQVLLQWSGECEVLTAYLAPVGGEPRQVPGDQATAIALGWTKDGRAAVLVPTDPGCGSDDGRSGLFLVRADRTSTRVFGPPPGTRLVDAALWTTVPGDG